MTKYFPGIEFLNSSDEESGAEEEEGKMEDEEDIDPESGDKRKRLSSISSNSGRSKRARTASENSNSRKRQRTSNSTSGRARINSVGSISSSKVKRTAEEWMTDKILTDEDYKRIEDKRLAWLMEGKAARNKGKRQSSPGTNFINSRKLSQAGI